MGSVSDQILFIEELVVLVTSGNSSKDALWVKCSNECGEERYQK